MAAPHKHDDEATRKKAYERWLAEGRPEGRHLEHWREAEAELADDAVKELGSTNPLEPVRKTKGSR
jgi:hypothetical protein